MLQLNLINQSGVSLNLVQLKKETKKILKVLMVKYKKLIKDLGEINVIFLAEIEIQKLNCNFLSQNKPTDVITFVQKEDKKLGGDIALCPSEIFKNSVFYKKDIAFLFYETILHGFLHLFGLKHNYNPLSLKKVYSLQEEILNKINLNKKIIYEYFKETTI